MKQLFYVFISFVVLVAIIVVSITAFNESILRSNLPKTIKLIVQTFVPPGDLYEFLAKEEIDLSNEGFVKQITFSNKYQGRHSVGILLENFSDTLYSVPLSNRYQLKSNIEINFYQKNKLILSRVVKDEYSPFIGLRGSGFIFFDYKCPEDLPIDQPIIAEIKIVVPDAELSSEYGPIKFYVRKMSDK